METSYPSGLIILTALLCAGGFSGALWVYRDTLHPLIYLLPMGAFIYVYMPLNQSCQSMFSAYFSREQIEYVQLINFLSLAALIIGCFLGGKRRRYGRGVAVGSGAQRISTEIKAGRITMVAMILGVPALLAYWWNIHLQGGLIAAYSEVKGGSAAAMSGYFRDPAFWAVSAAMLLLLGAAKKPLRIWHYVGVVVLIMPLLLQGFLASRRGPAFMGLVSVGTGWYLTQGKRPRLITLVASGGAIGLLLLCLVAFRADIYLGSNILSRVSVQSGIERIDEQFSKETTGNEAFYGANVILSSRSHERHYWGKRFATILFIRPIPKQWWPTKYEDVGMGDYVVNAGLGSGDQLLADVPEGAATGFAADLYLEFNLGGLVACGLIGWFFGRCWRKVCEGDNFAIINYGCLMAFSIFFVTQTIEAIISRYLVVIIPTVLLWYWVIGLPHVPLSGFKRSRRQRIGPEANPSP
jgi:oligosaccharide repeat unit polymerase